MRRWGLKVENSTLSLRALAFHLVKLKFFLSFSLISKKLKLKLKRNCLMNNRSKLNNELIILIFDFQPLFGSNSFLFISDFLLPTISNRRFIPNKKTAQAPLNKKGLKISFSSNYRILLPSQSHILFLSLKIHLFGRQRRT